jgi:oligoendopeptidase F
MGLDKLRPWDTAVDPDGRPPLKPFDDIKGLIDRAGPIFGHVDPQFRGYFDTMAANNLLDLDNRKGKAPGGYCQTLNFRKLPLIFMNAVGVDGDVRTLLH